MSCAGIGECRVEEEEEGGRGVEESVWGGTVGREEARAATGWVNGNHNHDDAVVGMLLGLETGRWEL